MTQERTDFLLHSVCNVSSTYLLFVFILTVSELGLDFSVIQSFSKDALSHDGSLSPGMYCLQKVEVHFQAK